MYLEKYHALGNDFLVVERSDFCDGKNFGELAKRLCSRKKCLGADGLIVVDKKTCQVDFFNADGSFAECCGNGLRCIVAYLQNFSDSDEFELKTADGVKKATVLTAQPFVCKVCLIGLLVGIALFSQVIYKLTPVVWRIAHTEFCNGAFFIAS